MADMSAIGSALASLKAAKDVAEAMVGLRDTSAFQGKLIEFQSKLIDANNAAFAAQDERAALLEEIGRLEKQVAALKTWETEKERYELTKVGDRGAFAYGLKEDVKSSEPPHNLCASCFNEDHKSILQEQVYDVGRAHVLICHRCNAEIYIRGMRQPEHTSTRRR